VVKPVEVVKLVEVVKPVEAVKVGLHRYEVHISESGGSGETHWEDKLSDSRGDLYRPGGNLYPLERISHEMYIVDRLFTF
jgi:hypothetical protein